MTIFSVLVLLLIRGVAAVQNCHSDCVPFACHGPTEFNCEQCAGKKVLEIDRCICKPGWFTVTTSCDTYVPNCKTIEIVSGVVSCTACQTLRDTLTAGACTRSTVPFFLRSTNAGYTGSAQDKSDANYFVANQCLSLNTIGKCLECHKGATLQGSGACLTTNTNCFETDGSGKCTKAKPHYYIVSDTVPSFGYCVGSCRTCADGRYGRCKSCSVGFYFKLNNDSSVLGNCYPCDPSCKTCTGPLETDCSSAVSGYFVERDDPATTGKVKICSSDCAHCTSATHCIFCKTKFISMDGVCSTTTNTIASCLYQYTYTANSTTVCLRYTTAFLTTTDYKAYTVTASDATTKCFEYEFASDRITMRCKECLSGYILMNGICTFVSGVTIASCSVGVALSTTTVACLECFPPNVISTNKAVCQTTCGASETVANVGSQVCTPCPEWCVTCQFIDQTVKCTQCEANFILYKDQCMTTSCGNGIITLNKECDPSTSPSVCSADCLNMLPSECVSATDCTREIFALQSSAEDTLQLVLTPRYTDKVNFAVHSDIVYDSSDPAALKFLCGRLLPEITDPTAVCLFNSVTSVVTIRTSRTMMLVLLGKPTTEVVPHGVIVSRKYISELAFKVANKCAVSVNKAHISKPFLITTPPVAPSNQDLEMTYELLDPSVCVSNAAWQTTSVKLNSVDQPQAITDMNADLSSGTIASGFKISASRLGQEYLITYNLVVTFCDASTGQASGTSRITIAGTVKSFVLSSGSKMAVLGGDSPIELLFNVIVVSPDFSQILVKIDDVIANSSEYSVTFTPHIQKLVFKAKPSTTQQTFTLEVGYPGYLSEFLVLRRTQEVLFPAISLSKTFKIGHQLSFWTSVGSEVSYSTYCYSKSSGLKLFSTASTASNYQNNLGNSVPSQDSVSLQIIFTKGATQAIYSFDLNIETGTVPTQPPYSELLLTTMHRDGSVLHSTNNFLAWGFPQIGWVASLNLPPTTVAVVRSSAGESTLPLALTNTGNKIATDPKIPTTQTSRPSSAVVDIMYLEQSGTYRQTRSLLGVYTPPTSSVSVTELLGSFGMMSVFTVEVSTQAATNLYNMHDARQHKATLVLKYSTGAKIPTGQLPVYVPGTDLYTVAEFHAVVWSSVSTATKPRVSVMLFDFNSFEETSSVELASTQTSITSNTPVQLFTEWATGLAARVSSADTTTAIKKLTFAAFEANQIYFGCLHGTWCQEETLTQLAQARWTLLLSFKIVWDGVTDKTQYLTWDTSVLKSSFLNAVTADSQDLKDVDQDWLATELKRESAALFAFASSKRQVYPRTSFGLVESLKPMLTLTKANLDQHTSAVAHLFQSYILRYGGFTSPDHCTQTLNGVYKDLLGLNELRLIRYTQVSAPALFENEVVMSGGLTITEPLQGNYLLWVGDSVAVELKNLKFEPALESYELSVIVLKDSTFDALSKLLDKFNLTTSLNQSRTSVGFTSNFELVYPKVTPDTEINIYRDLEECRGTPCNVNKQLTSGSGTIILCECLTQTTPPVANPAAQPATPNPKDPPKGGNPVTNFTETLGGTISGLGSQASRGAKCFLSENSECVHNKHVWLNSVIVIFGVMTLLSVLACLADKRLITPKAIKFTSEGKIRIVVSNTLAQEFGDRDTEGAKLQIASDVPFERNNSDGMSATSSGSSESAGALYANLPKAQGLKIRALLANFPESLVKKSLLSPEVTTPLTGFAKFKLVGLLSHSITSIFTSQCKLHSRKTSIVLLYLRCVYELALSMFFAMGIEQGSQDYLQKLALRCFFSISIVAVMVPIIKKMVRGDSSIHMSAIWCCFCRPESKLTRKMSEETTQTLGQQKELATPTQPYQMQPRNPLKTRNRSWANNNRQPRSVQKVSPANSVVLSSKQVERREALDSIPDRQPSIQSLMNEPTRALQPTVELSSNTDHLASQNDVTAFKVGLIWFGYLLMYALLCLSILVIFAVSKLNDDSGNWPFGYWYVIQFAMSSTFGSLPSIFFQYFWLACRIHYLNKHGSNPPAKPDFIGRPHFFINNDVFTMADLIEFEKQSPDLPSPAEEARLGDAA